jgi:hypothetical protein
MASALSTLALALALGAPTSAGDVDDTTLAQVAPSSDRVVALEDGARVEGRLETSDGRREDGALLDRYTLEGSAGQHLVLTVRSPEFDTWVSISGPDGFIARNDDSPGMGTNSALRLPLPVDGTYTVDVSSYAPGSAGTYNVEVRLGEGSAPVAQEVRRIVRAGESVEGALRAGAPTLRSGEHFETWIYEGTAGERVAFSLTSTDFDTYLMLRGDGGLSLDNDDRAEGTLDSYIEATLPTNGPVRLIVTSYAPGETGSYRLEARSLGATESTTGAPLTLGVPVDGTLRATDPTRAGGQHAQRWIYNGTAGELVTIDLESSAFDTTLALDTPSGNVLTNDDVERRNTNSRINFRLEESGPHVVTVSSYLAGVTGPYQLVVRGQAIEAVVEDVVDPTTDTPLPGNLAIGEAVSGRLGRRSPQLDSGEFYEALTLRGSTGQGLTIRMESDQFDTYLMLRGPGGFTIDNDDGGADEGTNSRIEVALPADGEYTVLATSYAPGETGRFTIRVEEGTTITQGARGRTFAIVAGISDYGGQGDLPFCAEDAAKLGDALRDAGATPDEAIVLTDAQVTSAALEHAFDQMASRVGPDDMFLFFYSGHGGYVENRRELDGRDETLILRDRAVTDDEVAGWFDRIDARLAVIALDSCFSGGFARDVISAPNRMGVFSSEEDVTSNVAARFEAGGYLSLFFRQGLEGAADTDPRDGVITAGEISQYLRRQWSEHGMTSESSETAESAIAYQNLVIDRGAVKVTDVVVYNR